MLFMETDVELLPLLDELTATSSRLVGQVLQVTPTERGGWGILLARGPGSRRIYFQVRDCKDGLAARGSLVTFEPWRHTPNRPARDLQVLAVPEKGK
jgi:hypothetical protein